MDSKQIRRDNLLALLKKYGTLESLADATGANPSHLSQIKNRTRNMGDKIARQIENGLARPHGWMDAAHKDQKELEAAGGLVSNGKTRELLEHLVALPDGLRDHLLRKAARLHTYADQLQPFHRQNLRPPKEPHLYRTWGEQLEEDIARVIDGGAAAVRKRQS